MREMVAGDDRGLGLLLLVALIIVTVVVFGSLIFNYVQDTRQYDSNYCRDYAQWIDFRIALKPEQAINVEVAKRVCECQWHPYLPGLQYQGYTECWRR